MTASLPNDVGPSVALAVRPPLLRDVLSRTLSASTAEIVVVPDDPAELALDIVARRYDIALISGALPTGLEADLVLIVAPPDGDVAPDPPLRRSADVIDIVHLDEVLAAVEAWRRQHVANAS